MLSTESISPKAFYGQRPYGIKRWHNVSLNNSDNYISLYSDLPGFDCPPNELEDHPMVIELTLCQEYVEKHFKKCGDTFFICDHTIYFHPGNVRFIFFSDQHKKISISLAEQLLETKTLHLYRKRLEVRTCPSLFLSNQEQVEIELNQKGIEEDSKINKFKGLLYGYYIGATLSSSQESVKKLSTLRHIQDVISAIASNEDRKPTTQQENTLKLLLDEMSPIKNEFRKLQLDNSTANYVWAFINRFFQVKADYSVPTFSQLVTGIQGENSSINESYSIRWIANQLTRLEGTQVKRQLLDPDESAILVVNKSLSNVKGLDDLEKKLFAHWANGVLLNKYYEGGCTAYQQDLAYDVTVAAKELMGSEWENSLAKKNLNGIRHIVAGESFDLEYGNGLIPSIAAVILKSDSWEQMLKFMQNKGMYDYRLAFALYGELIGFANLYSTFTDNLLQMESSYVWKVYQEFFGQLFDERIVHAQIQSSNDIALQELVGLNSKHEIHQVEQEKTIQIPPSIQSVLSSPEFMELDRRHKGAKSYYEHIILEIVKESSDDQHVWEKINNRDHFFNGTKTEWQKIVKKYGPINKKKKRNTIPEGHQESISFTPESPSSPFWCDPNAWSYIVDLIPQNSRKSLKRDLDWLKSEYGKGQESQYYAKASRDDKMVIDAFCNLKIKDPKTQKYFTKKLRETIKEKLYSLYNVKE